MRAHWLDKGFDDGRGLDAEDLRAEGVLCERVPEGSARERLDALKRERGYLQEDEIALRPSTAGLDGICAKFVDEHLHDEDEVRWIREGEGIFDIRSRGDRYVRVLVEVADLIIVWSSPGFVDIPGSVISAEE